MYKKEDLDAFNNEEQYVDFVAKSRQEYWEKSRAFKQNASIAKRRRMFIGKLMKKNNVTSVLEIGCNSGPNLLGCKKWGSNNIKLAGIDISEDAIKYANKLLSNQAQLSVGSIYDLSRYGDNSFDVVFSCTVLQHIPSEKVVSVLEQMKRIAKRFIFTIEDHGEEDKVYWYRDGIPQRWTNNYAEKFKLAGLNSKTLYMGDLIKDAVVGGANHIIYASKTNEGFIVDKLENM